MTTQQLSNRIAAIAESIALLAATGCTADINGRNLLRELISQLRDDVDEIGRIEQCFSL